MTKTPSQVKNIVEDWIKYTEVNFQDTTSKEKPKNPHLEWIFKIRDIMVVYMIEKRTDRITFALPINFAPEHQKATRELNDKEFLQFLINIMEPLAIAGINAKFQQNEKEIQQITLETFIDTEFLERGKFFDKWDQIMNFKEILVKKIQIKFGVNKISTTSDSGISSKSIYG